MIDIYNIGRPEFHDRVVQIMGSYRSGRGEEHFTTVTRHAMMLYEELHPRHQLDSRFRTILWAAAMLHDIGADAKCGDSPFSHAWRSADIILREDVRDNDIAAHEIAVVASLHRREDSDEDEILGMTYEPVKPFITPELLKLSAILRVADGLDRYPDPRITKFTLIGDTVLVQGTGTGFGDNFEQAVAKSGLLKKELGLELSR